MASRWQRSANCTVEGSNKQPLWKPFLIHSCWVCWLICFVWLLVQSKNITRLGPFVYAKAAELFFYTHCFVLFCSVLSWLRAWTFSLSVQVCMASFDGVCTKLHAPSKFWAVWVFYLNSLHVLPEYTFLPGAPVSSHSHATRLIGNDGLSCKYQLSTL